jgi:TatD DNase family protein
MDLIDTHAHLDEYGDIDAIVSTAREAGLTAIVGVGMGVESNGRILEIAGRYPGFVYPAIGWYPADLTRDAMEAHLAYVEINIVNAVAVGEIGLDYLSHIREEVPKVFQQEVLEALLRIAQSHGKPALLHTRYSWKDALGLALDVGLERAVFHSFTGPGKVLRILLDAGYYVSVSPAVAYNREMQRVARETPLDRLLLETDCPVVFAEHRTGDEPPATPADLLKTLRAVASVTGIPEDEVAAATTANAKRLFGIG